MKPPNTGTNTSTNETLRFHFLRIVLATKFIKFIIILGKNVANVSAYSIFIVVSCEQITRHVQFTGLTGLTNCVAIYLLKTQIIKIIKEQFSLSSKSYVIHV